MAVTDFRGAWSTAQHGPGVGVIFNGASYICLVKDPDVAPNINPNDWGIMDAVRARGPPGEDLGGELCRAGNHDAVARKSRVIQPASVFLE